jgi:hypothetical protein
VGVPILVGHKYNQTPFQLGAVFRVNSGEDVRFWEDVWVGDVPLKLVFPDLYEQCGRKCAWLVLVGMRMNGP